MISMRVFCVVLLSAGVLQAQAPARQEFEVASIKPSGPDDGRTLVQVLPGGGLRTSGATVKFLVSLAYDITSFNISGPAWINSDRFSILAKADRSSADDPNYDPRQITQRQYDSMREQMRPKLQTLLAGRFQLKVHRETREEPVYSLVVGKNGAKLDPSKDFHGLGGGKGQFKANGASMEMLAGALAGQLGRPVIDRTGLAGAFDFKLEWTPDAAQADAAPVDAGPSLFTALQEQLGLKLESTKAPAEVIVIDHVERPSEN
jgi:uncharacterized protein (TIGR03435 family)